MNKKIELQICQRHLISDYTLKLNLALDAAEDTIKDYTLNSLLLLLLLIFQHLLWLHLLVLCVVWRIRLLEVHHLVK